VTHDIGFKRDIAPLFRAEDVGAMSAYFDLSSYKDVSKHVDEIYLRVAEGSMPCDEAWSDEKVRRFREWIDAGMAP
jgi:hypothetical protein